MKNPGFVCDILSPVTLAILTIKLLSIKQERVQVRSRLNLYGGCKVHCRKMHVLKEVYYNLTPAKSVFSWL